MKKLIAVATASALVAGGVGAIAATKSRDEISRCVVSGAHTVTSNDDVRVYELDKGFRGNSSATGLYACRYSTGKKVALGTAYVNNDETGDGGIVRYIRDISLSDRAGGTTPRVAYVDTNCVNRDPCTHAIVVKSMGSGKVERRFKAGGPFDYLELSVPTDQDGIAIAWLETANNGGTCEGGGCKVHLIKESGDKVLDQGTDINPDRFSALVTDRPGIVRSGGSNEFVWEKGGVMKVASFND
jgi:hypothetical protein